MITALVFRSSAEEEGGSAGSGVIVWATAERIAMSEVAGSSGYSRGGKQGLHPAHSLLLQTSEIVIQVGCQIHRSQRQEQWPREADLYALRYTVHSGGKLHEM